MTPEYPFRRALAPLPASLIDELLETFTRIIRNFREHRWEPSELNGGKLCEVAYSILHGHVTENYPDRSDKPANMHDACRDLQDAPKRFGRSIRVQIPRMLVALYEIRSNRGVGHVGGDVDPNHMDASAVVAMSKWVLAELVRIFQGIDTKAAAALVDALVEREVPLIWEVMGRKRVLRPGISQRDETLLLLYGCSEPTNETKLVQWIEVSRTAAYRRDVLRPAHKARLIEYDQASGTVQISPRGSALVEDKLLPATTGLPMHG